MKRIILSKLVGITLGITLIFGMGLLVRTSSAVDKIKWRMQTALPPASYAYVHFYKPFCDLVKEKSNNKMEIECMPPGAILASKQIFDGVKKGVVQAGGSVGAYHGRIIPEAYIEFGLPCNFKNSEQFYDFYYNYNQGAFMQALNKAYNEQGAHFIAEAAFRNGFQTKFPINDINDVSGKKIRAVGSMAKLVNALGGSAVTVASVEQYTALQRGTVDGTIMAIYATRTYKLYEVTDYISLPPIGFSGLDIYCNLDAYNNLSEELKKVVDQAGIEASKIYRRAYLEKELKDIEQAKSNGVEVIKLTEEKFDEFRKAAIPIWESYGKKSDRCNEMINLLKSY